MAGDRAVVAERVVVVGQGYGGLALALRAVEVGFDVVGHDRQDRRIASLADGVSFVEDIPDDSVRQALDTGRYLPTTDPEDLRGFDFAIIAVPTTLREGLPDTSVIEEAAIHLGRHLRPAATVVLESTGYPGTTEGLLVPTLERTSGLAAGRDFHVGFSPERIDPGNTVWHLRNTPKITSGIDAESLTRVDAFYGRLVDTTVPVSSTQQAELAKLLENTFRHVNIALVNELAVMAYDLGIDINEAIDAAATKPFGYMAFRPGPGIGGHYVQTDPSYLSWHVRRRLDRALRFAELANEMNDRMPEYVVTRVVSLLNTRQLAVNGSRILVLGLSYKRNTGDMRESPSLRIIELLRGLGAEVRAADPHVREHQVPTWVSRTELTAAEAIGSDLIMLLTDHDEFDYDLISAGDIPVLDTRYRVFGSAVEHL